MNHGIGWKLLLWFYSLIAAALGGIGAAITSALAGQAIGALDFTPRQIGAIAIGGAIVAVAAYLKEKPLPRLEE
jgi:hypothetical protein